MAERFISREITETVVGGTSAIDISGLSVETLEDAYAFVKAYGYDLNDSVDLEKVWSFHRRAVALLNDSILQEEEVLPEQLSDPSRLQDIGYLFLQARSVGHEDPVIQKWACAILRVMHVYAHTENDFFYQFSRQIQDQVLKDFRDHVVEDPVRGTYLASLKLHKYEIKPFKGSTSAVIKLLAKPGSVSITLLDKLGLRFVTRNIYDSYRVVKILIDEHIVNFSNIMPDQSRNNLYPVNLFFEVIKSVPSDATGEEIDRAMNEKMEMSEERAEYNKRENIYSSDDFRFIKFIARKLVTVEVGGQPFRFFFPFEIQIVDSSTYNENLVGPGAHEEYKKRQLESARRRILGYC